MSVLDTVPFPFHDPTAQELHTRLTQAFPSGQKALSVAETVAEIPVYEINFDDPPYYVWADVLRKGATAGANRALAEAARGRLNATSPVRLFLERLLVNQPTPTEGEPRGADGAANFLSGSSAVVEEEALLFRDDLLLPMGRVPALIQTLEQLMARAPAVCQLEVDINGSPQAGTAFRVGKEHLLTNWHVVHRKSDGTRATALVAHFGFEDDGAGNLLTAVAVPGDPASIVASKEDDWAVFRAVGVLADEWSVIPLAAAAIPQVGDAAYIIQHPMGSRKRLGFVRNQITNVTDRVAHYLTDTQAGSSGSPVFDAEGRLVALHHAGGQPQEFPGQPPLKKNEGIRISRILEDFRRLGVVV